jgi:DNA polymerase III delta prime subunit
MSTTGAVKQLDPNRKSKASLEFEKTLRSKVVGQDAAIQKVSEIYQMFLAGLNAPGRPIGNLLFLGPSGTGKTKVVEAIAETLFNNPQALIKIDCAEFQHSHEIAKLVGCFIPGTGVLLSDGTTKPIEQVKVGDWVITKNGEPHLVTFLHQYKYKGVLTRLMVGNSNVPVVCTSPHKVWAIKQPFVGRRASTRTGRDLSNLYQSENLQYVPAGELRKGDVVVYPRQHLEPSEVTLDLAEYASVMPKLCFDDDYVWSKGGVGDLIKIRRFIKVDKDFTRLAGFYVSEGGNSKSRKTINFTFGSQVQEQPCVQEVRDILGRVFIGGAVHVRERKSHSTRIHYHSRVVSRLMADLFGDHTLNKHLPVWFLQLSPDLLWNFLDTAILGDGGKTVRRRLDYSTSSPNLASQMRLLIHNLGFVTQMQRQVPKPDKRGYKTVPRYRLYMAGEQIQSFVQNLPMCGKSINIFNPGNSGIQRMAHVDDDYVYSRIKAVDEVEYEGFVYDFSVEEKTSYVVENMVVSNSPPGYLGHRETHPLLTQEALNQWHTPEHQITLLLFDEIEKASDSLWNLLLGVLDKATLTLGDTRRVDLSRCLIVMTSNLGASQMQGLAEGGMGFRSPDSSIDDQFDTKIERVAEGAAKRKFSPEFMNRLDKVVVFKTLREEHLKEILDIELGIVQRRILSCVGNSQFVFTCSDAVKTVLLKEGIDPKYGARHLKRTIERMLVSPLSNLVSSGQITLGDTIAIDIDKTGTLTFTLLTQGALAPVMAEKLQTTSPTEAKTRLKKANELYNEVNKLDDVHGLNNLLKRLQEGLTEREIDRLNHEPPVSYTGRQRPVTKPKPKPTESKK